MHYLVTGGCGFIGSHLAASLLADRFRVTVLDNLSSGERDKCPEGATFIEGDIRDYDTVSQIMHEVGGCFHLAAVASVEQCNKAWRDTHTANVTGTINIFAAAKNTGGTPVVYASSAAVYGNNDQLPLSEDSATQPLTSYGQDKLSCEQYGRIAWRMHGVPNIGLRLFNVFGPGQNPSSQYSGVITAFIERIKAGESVTIHGDGEQTRDFIYIDDIVRLFRAAMDYDDKQHHVVNGCTGTSVTINDLVSTIESITKQAVDKQHGPSRAGDIKHSRGNPEGARTLLNFSAEIPFADGMRQFIGDSGMESAA